MVGGCRMYRPVQHPSQVIAAVDAGSFSTLLAPEEVCHCLD